VLAFQLTQRIEVREQFVALHRYSLCWSSFKMYRPRSAESLDMQVAGTRRRSRRKPRPIHSSPSSCAQENCAWGRRGGHVVDAGFSDGLSKFSTVKAGGTS
jgi:hypothetical protein